MFIAEIFSSIQGEGELAGMPSVFVRTSGCNLRCHWCDTPYASWNPEGTEMSTAEIVEKVVSFNARHVVLTGGEPMVAKDIHDLASLLHEKKKHITIETAATVSPENIACDLASLSPKLANSTPDANAGSGWQKRHEERRLNFDVLRQWIDRYPYQLKFVVAAESDLVEIQALIAKIDRPIPAENILLMPEGTTVEVLRERAAWLAKLCMQTGFRYTPRLHIELFGNVRGT